MAPGVAASHKNWREQVASWHVHTDSGTVAARRCVKKRALTDECPYTRAGIDRQVGRQVVSAFLHHGGHVQKREALCRVDTILQDLPRRQHVEAFRLRRTLTIVAVQQTHVEDAVQEATWRGCGPGCVVEESIVAQSIVLVDQGANAFIDHLKLQQRTRQKFELAPVACEKARLRREGW